VRILLLSDIHANLEALDACLAAAPSFDVIVNLGDIVGYGASPNEVTNRSRELGKVFVRGNHDKAATGVMNLEDFNPMAATAALWTRNALTPENLEWLRALPHGPVSLPGFPAVQLVHGSPNDEDEYVVSLGDALAPLITLTMPLTFFGWIPSRIQNRGASRIGSAATQRHGPLPDQSGIGGAAARWRLASRVCSVRYRRANRPLSSHALQPERGAGPHL
jgi:predicted phosphodiesterase